MDDAQKSPIQVAYERRNRDLDPQLVWRGKDEQDWSDLVVHAPPLYIQEKVHPKVLIDDLLRETIERRQDPEQRFVERALLEEPEFRYIATGGGAYDRFSKNEVANLSKD